MRAISWSQTKYLLFERFSPRVWQPPGFLLLAILLGFGAVWLPLPLALVLTGGAGLVLLLVVQPMVGLALALLAGPFGALENILFGGTLLNSGQLLLLFAMGSWILRGLAHRRLRVTRTFLSGPLLLFLYVASLSLLNGTSLELGLKELLKWLEIGLIMLMIWDLGTSAEPRESPSRRLLGLPRMTGWVLVMLLMAGLSQALVGIWQFGLRGTGPAHFRIVDDFYRAYGTFEQPNPFGGYVNLTAMLSWGSFLGLVLFYWHRKAPRPHGRRLTEPASSLAAIIGMILLGGGAIISSLALLFSWSRGAWLGHAAGLIMLVLFLPRKRWRGVILLFLIVTIGAGLFFAGEYLGLLPTGLVERISEFGQDLQFGDVRGVDINDSNYAVLERLAHWQAAAEMARDNLWLGVGFGNYEPAYADYALLNWPDALGHAHNYYLNILAEAGILGLIAYLFFWTAVVWQTVRVLKWRDWPERGVALGLLAAWATLTVHHLVDKLYVNNIYIHLGAMLGLLQLLDGRSPLGQAKMRLVGGRILE